MITRNFRPLLLLAAVLCAIGAAEISAEAEAEPSADTNTPAEVVDTDTDSAPTETETDTDSSAKLVFSPEIEKLLSETSDSEDYTSLERCISHRTIRNSEVLDDRHIVFEMPSKKFYLVQFKHRCLRLRPGSTLIYEPRGGQLCRLDQIQASNFGIRDIGPPCSIPGFLEVAPEQVAMLKDALAARRQ